MPWLEFHQDIHIAVRPEIIPENGPKQGQPADVVPFAEISDFLLIELNLCHLASEYTTGPSRKLPKGA